MKNEIKSIIKKRFNLALDRIPLPNMIIDHFKSMQYNDLYFHAHNLAKQTAGTPIAQVYRKVTYLAREAWNISDSLDELSDHIWEESHAKASA